VGISHQAFSQECDMYIGGGAIVLIVVVLLILFLVRR
jgi:hypothetical protein